MFAKDLISEEVNQLDTDPYIDPYAADDILNPVKRSDSDQAFLLGLSYGLNPIILLAPAINFAMYWNPLIIGIELSDSDLFGIWEKERRENFGSSRFRANNQFIKWFASENFYLIFARENRSVELFNRTYNRTNGKALFDMYVESSFFSLGIGFLRFNEIGYLGIDILRLNFLGKNSVSVIEHWETWSILSKNRDPLNENIEERSNKWEDTLSTPSGFLIKVGLYF